MHFLKNTSIAVFWLQTFTLFWGFLFVWGVFLGGVLFGFVVLCLVFNFCKTTEALKSPPKTGTLGEEKAVHHKNYNPNPTNLPHLGLLSWLGWVQLVAQDFIQAPPPCSPNHDRLFLGQALNTSWVFQGLYLTSVLVLNLFLSCNAKEAKAEWVPYFHAPY